MDVTVTTSFGVSVTSSADRFTFAALMAPTPASPSGPIAASNGYDTPTFSWSLVAGANHYYLYVADAITGAAVITNPSVPGTSYTSSTALTPGHGYTWYVAAESTNGADVAWSGPTELLPCLAGATDTDWPQRNHSGERSHHDRDANLGACPRGGSLLPLFARYDSRRRAAHQQRPGRQRIDFRFRDAAVGRRLYLVCRRRKRSWDRWPHRLELADVLARRRHFSSAGGRSGPSGSIAAAANFDTPTFSWSSISGANHYYLYVLDATTNQPVVNKPSVSGTTFTGTPLTPGHSFIWYIGAASVTGAISWSWQTFALAALAVPTQLGPSGTIQPSSGYLTPTFSWTSVTGAAQYYVYLLDATTGQAIINNAHVGGTSWPASAPLTAGHRYLWYVAAESASGAAFWSAPDGFTFAAV